MNNSPSLKEMLATFLKIGTVAFGGMYSMLAFFERELVHKKRWISQDDLTESIVIGQITPGAPIVNTGIFLGYKLKRLKGSLSAITGIVLPSFVIILVIAHYYTQYHDIKIVQSALRAVSAAVVGLIASVVFNMAKATLRDSRNVIFAVAAFICLALFKLNPIAIIIFAGITGFALFWRGRQ